MNLLHNIKHCCKKSWLAVALSSLLLASCGGGVLLAGIGGTGISFGSIIAFASVVVNGSHLDDVGASVTLDGIQSAPGVLHGGLKLGMVIKVSGEFNGNIGSATTIEYNDNLEGPVCAGLPSVDGVRTLRVLGQTVILDATTVVDNAADIDSIVLADVVEVSGLPDQNGAIHASFIEVKTAALDVEVKGKISGLDTSPGVGTFMINDLQVNYTDTDIDNSIPNDALLDGLFVEVKATANGTCDSPVPLTDSVDASNRACHRWCGQYHCW
jgi:hypothetical protein